jgi:hypothetical protein
MRNFYRFAAVLALAFLLNSLVAVLPVSQASPANLTAVREFTATFVPTAPPVPTVPTVPIATPTATLTSTPVATPVTLLHFPFVIRQD